MPYQCHVRVGDNTDKHLFLPSSFPHCIKKSLLNLLFSRLIVPALSAPQKSSRSLITNMTLHLTLCSIALLYWEAQNWTLQMQPHQRGERREHLLQPAGNTTLPNIAQEAVCHLCHGSALLARRWSPTSI